MQYTTIDLYSYFSRAREGAECGTLTLLCHDDLTEMQCARERPAILIFPGGAYATLSAREAEPIAAQYFANGYQCFILSYDVAPHCYPQQLLQAGMAMLWLRREGRRYGVDPEHIAVAGFSAGGHLAGCVSLLWDDPALGEAFGEECARIRPDAAVLSYPVVTSDERFWNADSFRNFCGSAVPYARYSLERCARSDAPPAFLWATTPDDCVPVENALMLYSALHGAGVPVELHIFEEGWHGLSTADIETSDKEQPFMARVRTWLPQSMSFLRAHGFAVKACPRK